MTGRKNLPAGAPRRASQRRALHAAQPAAAQPAIAPGMAASWRGMSGKVIEACGDGVHVIIEADGRKWRCLIVETRFGR